MPTYGKKYQKDGKLVICNLQPTKQVQGIPVIWSAQFKYFFGFILSIYHLLFFQDKKADLCIHTYVDDVLKMLMQRLDLDIPEYDPVFDPVKQVGT